MSRVLILGGSTEASALARALASIDGVDVTTSFAGRTSAPRAAAGRTRVGGFGGADGLAKHLRAERVDALVDVTHPFAARMRWHALEAATDTGVPRLRVERPPWTAGTSDRWTSVADLDAAAAEIDRSPSARRVFLTTGRTDLDPFIRCRETWFLVRAIEPPDPFPLFDARVVLDRGPFTLEAERALMVEHRIDSLVTKNSGGDAAAAKLDAARQLGVPVVMVQRPPNPPGPLVADVDDALVWLSDVLGRPLLPQPAPGDG